MSGKVWAIFGKRTEHFLKHGTELGLHLLIVLSPVFFGAAPDWAYLPARALILFLAGLTVLRMYTNGRRRPVWTWCSIPAALFVGYVLFSILPLPGFVLETLSPEASAHYQEVSQWRAEMERSLLAPLREGVAETNTNVNQDTVPSTLSLDPWRTREALLGLITPLLVFFVAANLGGSRRQTKRLLATIAATAGLLSVYGLYISFTGRIQSLEVTNRWVTGRVAGTFVNPNHFAFYLELALPLTFAMAASFFLPSGVEEKTGWRGVLWRLRRGLGPGFVLVAASLAVMFLALIHTQSRIGLAGFFLTVVVVGTILLAPKRRPHALAGIALLLLVALGAANAWVGIGQSMSRFFSPASAQPVNRLRLWSDARAISQDFPLLGSGLGTFAMIFPRSRTIRTTIKFNHAHNDFLEVWTETGAVGLTLVLLAVTAALGEMLYLRRRRHDVFILLFSGCAMIALVAGLVHSVGDFGLRIPANGFLFALTGGLALAILRGPPSVQRRGAYEKRGGLRRRGQLIWGGAAGVILVVLLWDTAVGFQASLRFRSVHLKGLEVKKRQALLKKVFSLRPNEERYLMALISAEELETRMEFRKNEAEGGLRSALRGLERLGRAQVLHPASGDLMFVEGLFLSRMDRRFRRRKPRASHAVNPPGDNREREDGIDVLREPIGRLAWKALRRAADWEPMRFAFHYSLGRYGVFRWEYLGEEDRRRTKDSIAKAASLAACGTLFGGQKLRVLRFVARQLRDKELGARVARARCVP